MKHFTPGDVVIVTLDILTETTARGVVLGAPTKSTLQVALNGGEVVVINRLNAQRVELSAQAA